MRLGYNTNGLAHHDCLTAIDVVGQIGYQSVALTIDHHCCNPFSDQGRIQLQQIKSRLAQYQLHNVIETGARFLLDPMHKHRPTLLSSQAQQRQQRIDFLKYAIDTAAELQSDCVSLWSGACDSQIDTQAGLERLAQSLTPVLDHAAQCNVVVGFEPEPGMFIDSMSSFFRLLQWVDHPKLQLTLDLGHLFCQGEIPMVPHIQKWADRIVNIHIEDMKGRQHVHLMFGEGEIDFRPIMQALVDIDYRFGVHVELSRHSHEGPAVAQRSLQFLAELLEQVRQRDQSL